MNQLSFKQMPDRINHLYAAHARTVTSSPAFVIEYSRACQMIVAVFEMVALKHRVSYNNRIVQFEKSKTNQ
jgi:hypothetical protein